MTSVPRTFTNPILPGFYPDPSICRVGEDFYLATSTFSYFPGIPLFHSRDLVHWEQLGHALTRTSQLDLSGCEHSHGIFAPTLRYHEGTFYLITTNVGGIGNFYVTASDVAGPWSDPVVLPTEGIDPTIFFDGDGTAYYLGTRGKRNASYWGDNEIYLQRLDVKRGEVVGPCHALWDGAAKNAFWAEGPHLYKKDGYYYLLIAEGGTGHEHAVTVARSRDLFGPYEACPNNPILTHRHLGRRHPIVNVGHGDFVDTPTGEWWIVALGSRPYGGYYRNMGRETFLAPVIWEDGWPVVCPGAGQVRTVEAAPNLAPAFMPKPPARDCFPGGEIGSQWITLRAPAARFATPRAGAADGIRLRLLPETLAKRASPAFLAMRQTHMNYALTARFSFSPACDGEGAGLALLQSDQYHLCLLRTREDGVHCVALTRVEKGIATRVAIAPYTGDITCLRIHADGQRLSFFYGPEETALSLLLDGVSAAFLSPDVAGGFVGTCMGLYAVGKQGYMDVEFAEISNEDAPGLEL